MQESGKAPPGAENFKAGGRSAEQIREGIERLERDSLVTVADYFLAQGRSMREKDTKGNGLSQSAPRLENCALALQRNLVSIKDLELALTIVEGDLKYAPTAEPGMISLEDKEAIHLTRLRSSLREMVDRRKRQEAYERAKNIEWTRETK